MNFREVPASGLNLAELTSGARGLSLAELDSIPTLVDAGLQVLVLCVYGRFRSNELARMLNVLGIPATFLQEGLEGLTRVGARER